MSITDPSAGRTYFPDDLQLIQAIRHDLAARVAPEVSSDMARDICRMAVDVLDCILSRRTVNDGLLRRRAAEKLSIAQQGEALLAAAGESMDAGEIGGVPAATQGAPALHGFTRDLDARIGALFPRLLALAARDEAAAPNIKALMTQLVQGDDAQQQESIDAATHAARVFAEKRAASEAKITQDDLENYLRCRFPDHAGLTVSAIRELPGGFGKTTILFDVDGLPGLPRSMVMRRDRSAGATEATVVDEYPLLAAVQGHGLPVPTPLWLEPDAAQLGLPFLVVGRLPGQIAGSLWAPDPTVCSEETARDLARVLAKLHAIPVESVGATGIWAPDARADAISHSIEYITDLWRRSQIEPNPVLDMCLEWLRLNQPPAPEHPVLVHSDVGFHNLLVDGWKISGLLDWELAHPGDANEDLCYVRPYVEQLMRWEDFVADYVAEGGQPYLADRSDFYAIWRDVRNAVFSGLCHRGFCMSANTDIRFGHAGMLYLKMMTQTAANRILTI